MLRSQFSSGFISADMRPRAQKLPIIAGATKTIQILKSGTIEIRDDIPKFIDMVRGKE
jgi:hypothetical protein